MSTISKLIKLIGKIILILLVLVVAVPIHVLVVEEFVRVYIANYETTPALITILLLAVGWFLTFLTIIHLAKLSGRRLKLVGLIVAILVASHLLWVVIKTPRTGISPTIAKALAPACGGKGIREAADYTGGPGPHPTLVFDSSGRLYESPRGLGPGWNPSSVAETELVLCVGEETSVWVTCPGGRLGPLSGRNALLREAQTGRVVHRFEGAVGSLKTSYKCPGYDDRSMDQTTLSGLRSVLEEYIKEGG